MTKKTNLIPIYLTFTSLVFFAALFQGCEEEYEQKIIIEYRLPDTMKFGTRDTLYFKIKSLQSSIDTVKVKESGIVYATFNNNTFGRDTFIWDVNLVYNPATPGNKDLEFWVRAGIHIKTHRFSINVVE